jgi:hypothetical protein
LEEEACKDIVNNAWETAVGLKQGVAGALRDVLRELVEWNKNVLGDLEKRISRMRKELKLWRRKYIGPEQVRKEEVLRFKLSRLEDQKELYWKQRAHVNWMQGGDRNTNFFHAAATERKKQNHVKCLKRENGVVVEAEEAMKDVATNYFSELFTSTAGTRVEELLEHVDPRVTPVMNEMLCKEYTAQEVKEALDSIGDLKAPGACNIL